MYCSYVSFSLISPKTPLDLQGIKWVGGKFRSSTDYVITYIFRQFFCTLSLRDCIDTDCSTKNTNPDSSSLGFQVNYCQVTLGKQDPSALLHKMGLGDLYFIIFFKNNIRICSRQNK